MKEIVQGRYIYIIVLLIVFIITWPVIQKVGQAQILKQPGGASADLGSQMLISSLIPSPMLSLSHTSAGYSFGGGDGGGLYLPGLSGPQLLMGGGSFMNFGDPIGLLGQGITPLNLGGGGFNNISLPIGLSQFSPSFNFPQTINSLFGFYSPTYNTSRATYLPRGSQHPFFQTGGYSYSTPYEMFPSGMGGGMSQWGGTSYSAPYGMVPSGMGGGMSQWGGTPYGGYPSFNLGGNYSPYTTPYTTPYSTPYGGSYYDRSAGSYMGSTSTYGTYPYGFFSNQPYGTFPAYSISLGSGYIYGSVIKKGGEPFSNAQIIIRSGLIVDSCSTRSDGSYKTKIVLAGQYYVTLVDPISGDVLKEKWLLISGPTVYDFLDVELASGKLKGVVKHETGTPLVGVKITAQSLDDLDFPTVNIKSDSEGKYMLKLPEGDYKVTVTYLPEGLGGKLTIDSIEIFSSGDTIQDIEFPMPLLKGEVEGENGESIEDAAIDFDPNPPVNGVIRTNSKGEFKVPLPAGSYEVKVKAEGYKDKTVYSFTIPRQGLYYYTFELDESDPEPPVIDSPSEDMEIEVGQNVNFSVDAEDPDGPDGLLSYSIEGPGSWPTSNDPNYSYETTLADVGEHIIKITVSDEQDSTIRYISVNVVYYMELQLEPGVNRICYPEDSNKTAFDLLPELGDPAQVKSILRYNPDHKVSYGVNGGIDDFPLNRWEGYIIYARQSVIVNLKIRSGDLTSCNYDLHKGVNLIGIPVVLAEEYSAYDFLRKLDEENVVSICRYNGKTGRDESAYWIGDRLVGIDFPIRMGEGYFVQMKNEKKLTLPFSLPSHYRLR